MLKLSEFKDDNILTKFDGDIPNTRDSYHTVKEIN